jgi:Asp/Glu/hydantoin racemase
MRILIVNGNTTQAITDRAVAVARATAGAAAEIVGVTAPFGPAVVTVASENEIAARAILQALAENHAGFDAAILAISFDTALFEARALLSIPVYGITEAALKAAAALSPRLGVITMGEASQPLYRDVLARYPEAQAIVGRSVIDMASVAAYVAAGSVDDRIVAEANRLAAETAAGAIVICGAALAGAGERLQARVACPLVDGVPAAVRAALAAAGAARNRSNR